MKKILSPVLAVLLLIICLSVPAFADAQLNHVTDEAGILYDSDIAALEERAAAVSEQYDCGVYIVTVEDFTDYSDTYYVKGFGEELFSSYDLGLGDDNCGILLILSMAPPSPTTARTRLRNIFWTISAMTTGIRASPTT